MENKVIKLGRKKPRGDAAGRRMDGCWAALGSASVPRGKKKASERFEEEAGRLGELFQETTSRDKVPDADRLIFGPRTPRSG